MARFPIPVDKHTPNEFIAAVQSVDNPEDAARFYRGLVEEIQGKMDAGEWQGPGPAEHYARLAIGIHFGREMPTSRVIMWRATFARHGAKLNPLPITDDRVFTVDGGTIYLRDEVKTFTLGTSGFFYGLIIVIALAAACGVMFAE